MKVYRAVESIWALRKVEIFSPTLITLITVLMSAKDYTFIQLLTVSTTTMEFKYFYLLLLLCQLRYHWL